MWITETTDRARSLPNYLVALFVGLLCAAATGCGDNPPDVPGSNTHFTLYFASQTPTSQTDSFEGEKVGRALLADYMKYVGIIPDIHSVSGVLTPDPPTVYGPLCTAFMDPLDPDNEALCGREYMLYHYLIRYRNNTGGSIYNDRLILYVSPLRGTPAVAPALGATLQSEQTPRDPYEEGTYLFDDRITGLAGGVGDARNRGIAVVGMHELGHLLTHLTEIEEHPEFHNGHYAYGCIMKEQLHYTDFIRNYDGSDGSNPLIFCRTDSEHTDEATTCHGKLRALFSLPYGVED